MAVGAALLYAGGDLLVKNAVRLAGRLGLSPLVIGLTVVAFGTSAPELAATLVSALQGAPQIALGNVIGSNTANLGLILGLTALVYPLVSARAFVRRELPIMLGVGVLLFPLLADGLTGRVEGVLLLLLLGLYLAYLLTTKPDDLELDESEDRVPLWRSLLLVLFGVALLVGGAQVLITGAVALAQAFGVPEEVIGLTLVAFGTSLPELASSVAAALRRETDIILGNVIGSNIFNVLAVLGTTALVSPIREPFALIDSDLVVMLGFSVAVLLLMWRSERLGRFGGGLLFGAYAFYIVTLYF